MENFTVAASAAPAPRISFNDRDNRALGLEGFRGRVVLVNFWATWCGPCLREMPSLERLQVRLGGAGFTVLALSVDRKGWAAMTPYIERLGLAKLPVYHDPSSAAARALGVQGLPTTILIDRQGREIGRLTGPAEWDSPESVALMRHYMGS